MAPKKNGKKKVENALPEDSTELPDGFDVYLRKRYWKRPMPPRKFELSEFVAAVDFSEESFE